MLTSGVLTLRPKRQVRPMRGLWPIGTISIAAITIGAMFVASSYPLFAQDQIRELVVKPDTDTTRNNLIESIKKDKKTIAEEIVDLSAIISAQKVLARSLRAKSKTGLLSTSLCDKSPLKGNCSKLTGTFSEPTTGETTDPTLNKENE